LLAVVVPAISLPGWQLPAGVDGEKNATVSLDGKKVVVFEKGYLNWWKPVHGDYGAYSVGMYGMLPVYLESMGATCVISPDLSDDDLRDADLLILIFPDDPWEEGQLRRIWDYVQGGGSLLVMGEHTVRKKSVPWSKGGNHFNEVLQPTAMRVRFDSATFEVGGWLQSYQPLAHPTTAGIGDDENEFGSVIGASVEARWPARPLVVGRWGWADPGKIVPDEEDPDGDFPGGDDPSEDELHAAALIGVDSEEADPDDASKMGNGRYDPGEKLGDLVLAAEQPLGDGKVIVFGDTSGLTNGLTIGCHRFTSRLLAYAAQPNTRYAGLSAQWLVVLVCVLLALLLAWRREVWLIAVVSVVCSLVIVVHTARVHSQGDILPDTEKLKTSYDMLNVSILEGRQAVVKMSDPVAVPPDDTVRPYGLAYIDASHMHAYSPEGWRDDGVMGLCLTLMRNGYLTLMLPELTPERLRGADVLVCIAPSREYSRSERMVVDRFVRDGGIFIYMIGRDRYSPGKSLLEQLRFRVGHSDWDAAQNDEPIPCSHFKTPYFQGEDYEAFVRFDAAWPVACLDDPSKRLLITRRDGLMPSDAEFRLIEIRRLRKGLIAVIGDTGFGMNKNLEHEDGSPFEGLRENADFWRYLLDLLRTGESQWIPPYRSPPEFFDTDVFSDGGGFQPALQWEDPPHGGQAGSLTEEGFAPTDDVHDEGVDELGGAAP